MKIAAGGEIGARGGLIMSYDNSKIKDLILKGCFKVLQAILATRRNERTPAEASQYLSAL